jgi:hypothetical protein
MEEEIYVGTAEKEANTAPEHGAGGATADARASDE